MIRDASPADYDAIAAIQIASWRSAYKGMLEDAYLKKPVHDDITTRWQNFTLETNGVLLVFEEDGAIGGFINVLASSPPYVDNLHVNPSQKRGGIGKKLMVGAAQRLIAQGQTSMWLTVLKANAPSIQFYEKLGAARGEERIATTNNQPVIDIPMTWDDLSVLANA